MPDRELPGPPSMLALFGRAGLATIPGASKLPFVGGGGGEVGDLALTLVDVQTDRDRLAAYDRVCGFDVSDWLPVTYPHMLAFPLHLALMTDASFPFAAIGLVHIANKIVSHRRIGAGERLSVRVWATPAEPHPRGRQFAIRTKVRVGEELVWEEISTNLKRGLGSASDAPATPSQAPPASVAPATAGPPPSSALPPTATWRLEGDLGRRYAAVSGDFNPIHVHWLTARGFGFPRAIAHGMWTKARCLAALGPELPGRFTVEVAFRRPILLPATVHFAEVRRGQTIVFGVRDAEGDAPHLDGLVSARALGA